MNPRGIDISLNAENRQHLLFLSLIAVINAVIYYDYWAGTTLFSGKDTFTCYMPLINYEVDCLREGSFPLWHPFMNFGFPYVEHVLNSALFPSHFLMALTGSSMIIYQRELLSWIILGGIGTYFCVRELGYSGLAGLVAAASFMFSGQLIVLPTWSIIVYNACCFPFLLLGYHRARRSSDPFSVLSIIFFALPIYGGYVSSSVHGIYYFVGYVIVDSLINRRPVWGIKYLLITIVPAMVLSMPKLLPMIASMGNYERMSVAEAQANPFEIISWYNLMSFLIPVKYYFSVYIGQLGIMALVYAAARRILKVDALLIMFLLSAWLLMVDSDGTFSLLHSVANAVLPMMKLTRNEWMYWNFPLTFAILYLSRYVDALLSSSGDNRMKIISAGVYVFLLTIVFFAAYNTSLHLQAYLIHVTLGVLWSLVLVFSAGARVRTVMMTILVLAEFLLLFNRVAVDEPIKKAGGYTDVVVTHQVFASESFMDDELVHQKMPFRVLDDEQRPAVSDSRQHPYLISGLDGNFIDNMNQKRFTGWWYNTQERADFARLKESPLLSEMEGRPLYGYFSSTDRKELPGVVTFDGISCSDFSFTVRSGQSGVFLLNQMYDERWQVIIDGNRSSPMRMDNFFMGVRLGPGEHSVHFIFRDRLFTISAVAAAATLIGIIAAAVFRSRMSAHRSGGLTSS